MQRLINNLAWLLPVVFLAGVLVYAYWWREQPQAAGGITGDFAQAQALASDAGVPLLIAVDSAPP